MLFREHDGALAGFPGNFPGLRPGQMVPYPEPVPDSLVGELGLHQVGCLPFEVEFRLRRYRFSFFAVGSDLNHVAHRSLRLAGRSRSGDRGGVGSRWGRGGGLDRFRSRGGCRRRRPELPRGARDRLRLFQIQTGADGPLAAGGKRLVKAKRRIGTGLGGLARRYGNFPVHLFPASGRF